MSAARATFALPDSDIQLSVIRHGHHGRPVLVFPTEAGRAEDFADHGMVDAVRDLVDRGAVSFFCVDSADAWTWSDRGIELEERARRHGHYQRWLEESVVPWIGEQLQGSAELITLGASMGAFHAVNFSFRRADLAPVAIGLSGNYDAGSFRSWGHRGDATYFANPADYVANLEGDHLEWLRGRLTILLVVGQGAFEVDPTGSLPATRSFADLLQHKGIRHELDVWGYDSAHDWPWWQRQLAHHLPRFV